MRLQGCREWQRVQRRRSEVGSANSNSWSGWSGGGVENEWRSSGDGVQADSFISAAKNEVASERANRRSSPD
jgi:hypothetical protein